MPREESRNTGGSSQAVAAFLRASVSGFAMPPLKIMLIRHSEKPIKDRNLLPNSIRGVEPDGTKSKDSLSVRGWQRAGALVRYFAPLDGQAPLDPTIAQPDCLFACRAYPTNTSLRPQQTLWPLAEELAIPVNCDFAEGEEPALVEAVNAQQGGVVLISWKHNQLPRIANFILGNKKQSPQSWPIDNFSTTWIFDRIAEGWSFQQRPQRLLAGDPATTIDFSAPANEPTSNP